MHVISYKILRDFGDIHSDSKESITNWYKLASKSQWSNFLEVQQVFHTAEAVGNFTIFNIKGNHYRLIVSIDYQGQLIYIKYVLTQAEYDKEK
ncbi:MAG: type II toxin-antitoxin system HigB family toxin [Moorea sp. SIO2B7]|nr:type II toxin-antitoxin system HigB family toxin [Moorena sp. SIO2B7]